MRSCLILLAMLMPFCSTLVRAEDWLDARKPVMIGDATVQIASVERKVVPLRLLGGKLTTSDNVHLNVFVVITNQSENRKINARGFAGTIVGHLDKSAPRLTDNFGNAYKQIDFGGKEIAMTAKNASIYPGKYAGDLLVFELPVKNIEFLHLELAALNIEEEGTIRFEIPVSMIDEKKRKEQEAKLRADDAEQLNRENKLAGADSSRKAADAERWHTWTIDGKKVEARFNGVVSGTVKLQRRDGSKVTINKDDLTKEDAAWIKSRSK